MNPDVFKLDVFTDGSFCSHKFKKAKGKEGFGSWGVIAFPPGCEIKESNAGYVDFGKVESNKLHAEYVGAEIISNNTAELTAMVQC